MKAPYWVISNHDVRFEPGFLKEMNEKAQDQEVGIVHGSGGGWDIFLLKDWMVQKYGLFDENLYPGYCEDMDYGMRFIHDDVKRILDLEADYYHGSKKNDYSDGSQTCDRTSNCSGYSRNPRAEQAISSSSGMSPQSHVEGETYKTPFNLEEMPLSFTTFDLSFVRRKHLGF